MEVYDCVSPIDSRYLWRDNELRIKVQEYSSLDILFKLKKIVPEVIVPRLGSLEVTLINIANSNQDKQMPKRVDGKHVGVIAVDEVFKNYAERLKTRIRDIGNLPLDFKNLENGGLNDRISDLAYFLISAFSVEANISEDIRQSFRSEINEFTHDESTLADRVGSSTMPHKVNPVEYEQIKSLWKAYLARMPFIILSQVVEHQGDSTNEDFPYHVFELSVALSYATKSLDESLSKLKVNV